GIQAGLLKAGHLLVESAPERFPLLAATLRRGAGHERADCLGDVAGADDIVEVGVGLETLEEAGAIHRRIDRGGAECAIICGHESLPPAEFGYGLDDGGRPRLAVPPEAAVIRQRVAVDVARAAGRGVAVE